MLGGAVPGVVWQPLGKFHLRRRVELLLRNAQSGGRDAGRQALGLQHFGVLKRLASAALTMLLRFKLADPTPDGTFAMLHAFTDLVDAQA